MASAPQSQLDKTNADGGLVYYPSGRVAILVSKDRGSKVITITADTDSGQILLTFNQLGTGSVEYTNGKPWLVVTEEGWSASDRKGLIMERGKFPRKQPQPLTCQINEHLSVTFQDRQNITATFRCEDILKTIECGEKLRRTESYTVKATGRRPNGKLDLDVDSIRQRQKDVGLSGSLYVPPGPHHFQTEHPGIGGLKAVLRAIPASSPFTATVRGLQDLDSRLDRIDLMPTPTYGSSAPGSLSGTTTTSASALGGAGDASAASTLRSTTFRAAGMPEDYGSPELSAGMQKLAHTMRPVDPKRQRHRAGRLKLPVLPMSAVQAALMSSTDAVRDELAVVVLLADWSPVCARLEAAAQAAHRDLVDAATASPASPSGHIKVCKVDASEGSMLQKKYCFRTVPMFLMYYEGKLVEATNKLRSSEEIKSTSLDALTRARKGIFLPDSFSFNGADNTALDFINPAWSMLSGAKGGAAQASA